MSDKTPKQRTAAGHEIPVPKRSTFMRDLKKVAKGDKPSGPARSPKKYVPGRPTV
jgi:hypothetical protein